jgi:redox-sensitive bicupin YhaK (pirin superfamily)
MKYRHIDRIVEGSQTMDGAGVRLVRVIGPSTVKEFDPFLMLDAFDSTNSADYTRGFPWHPHRGIETVTFLIQGDIEHGDSLGNKGSILDGGCQWMTAGSGILHQEMPQASERMLGLQLWINLPAAQKMTQPKYRDLVKEKIPVINQKGAQVGIIAGEFNGTKGAMKGDYVDATMLDISLEAGASLEIPLPHDNTVFVYIVEGGLFFDPDAVKDFQAYRRAVLLHKGDVVKLSASGKVPARCVLFSGPPLREPVAWGGPIVMNTQEELHQAFRELDDNTFIKSGK